MNFSPAFLAWWRRHFGAQTDALPTPPEEELWLKTVRYVVSCLGRDAGDEKINAVAIQVYEQMQFLVRR